MKGFNIAEQGHVVNMLAPIDIGGGAKTSDRVSMEGHAKIQVVITMGVVGNDTTVTFYESTTEAGGSEDAIGTVYYYQETTADGDTLAARTSGATITTGTNNNTTIVVDIDASSLTADHIYVGFKTSAAAAALISAVGILSGTRYQSGITATAIE